MNTFAAVSLPVARTLLELPCGHRVLNEVRSESRPDAASGRPAAPAPALVAA